MEREILLERVNKRERGKKEDKSVFERENESVRER